MDKNIFMLKIGSLAFGKKSISYIAFGMFLAGIAVGIFSIVHINNPNLSIALTAPVFFMSLIIPIIVVIKGIRRAEDSTKV